jgi:hypothetical protein
MRGSDAPRRHLTREIGILTSLRPHLELVQTRTFSSSRIYLRYRVAR